MTANTERLKTGSTNPLVRTDPQIWKILQSEQNRQEQTLEMIASENHTSPSVMAAVGSCLTNKYCEGYPGKRYYSGCTYYDDIERLAIQRVTKLFGCKFANVQPHSGSNANQAAFFAFMDPGDTYASVVLSDGGHLTHGSPVNLSGKWFNSVHYPLVYDESRADCGYIDYEAVHQLCMEHKPKLLLCGYSAYPRIINFERFRRIADDCGAILMADIAHIAGLVAGGAHPSPFPHAQVVTTTTHKTLRGPRSGLILSNEESIANAIDKAVFPGTHGGPHMHVIAGKAVCFGEALRHDFKRYAHQVVANARVLAQSLIDHGYHLSSGGTDNHLVLLDLRKTSVELTGKQAALWLESAGIITNKNTVPQENRSPFTTSGLRLGTPSLTTRGFKETEIKQVADWIHQVLICGGNDKIILQIRHDIDEFCRQFPLPR